jgi:hypothetical protein
MSSKASKRRGPTPETVRIEGDWKAAVRKALSKPKPATGWPKASKPRKSTKAKPAK